MTFPANKAYYQKFYKDGFPTDPSMVVNGSVTPVLFTAPFEIVDGAFTIINLALSFQGGKIDNPENFSGLIAPLTNGIEIGIYARGSASTTLIVPAIKNNRDLNVLAPRSTIFNYETPAKDVFIATFFADFDLSVSTNLAAGFSITINDDLTGLDWMEGLVRGSYS